MADGGIKTVNSGEGIREYDPYRIDGSEMYRIDQAINSYLKTITLTNETNEIPNDIKT